MKKLKVAVLGVTGAVGQEFLELLKERKFPIEELRLLASGRSAGKMIEFMGKGYRVEEANPDSFKGLDLVLSSAGGAISRELAPHIVKSGALMVDNTSAFRMDPEIPLVVPEINPEDIAKHKGIIANPNCSTIIMLVPLFPITKLRRSSALLPQLIRPRAVPEPKPWKSSRFRLRIFWLAGPFRKRSYRIRSRLMFSRITPRSVRMGIAKRKRKW
jgi:hypothetical protein